MQLSKHERRIDIDLGIVASFDRSLAEEQRKGALRIGGEEKL